MRKEGRVFALAKGKTLEDIAGDETLIAKLGNPITLENINEDALRRLVLLKLAVESVRADWVGVL